MAKKEYLECGVCGAMINPENGETRVPAGSNADTLESLRAEKERLQNDCSRIAAENEDLKERVKNGKDKSGEPGPVQRDFFANW